MSIVLPELHLSDFLLQLLSFKQATAGQVLGYPHLKFISAIIISDCLVVLVLSYVIRLNVDSRQIIDSKDLFSRDTIFQETPVDLFSPEKGAQYHPVIINRMYLMEGHDNGLEEF